MWWLIEARRPPKRYGSLTEDEAFELYDEMAELGHLEKRPEVLNGG